MHLKNYVESLLGLQVQVLQSWEMSVKVVHIAII